MKKILAVMVIVSLHHFSYSQDLTFSQFYEAPLLRNPALAGIFNGDIRVGTLHRSQWSSVTVPFQTSSLDIQYKLPIFNYNDFVTLGLQLSYDVAGDIKLKRTQLLPVVNFHKSLNDDVDNYLSFAFMGGPVQSQFDPTQAKLDDQFINGSFSPSNQSAEVFSNTGFSYWDFSGGVSKSATFGNENRYYYGLALYHILQPKVNFFSSSSKTFLQKKWAFNGGIATPLSDNNRLLGFADYFRQGGNRQFHAGFLYETDIVQFDENDNISFAVGGFYRWADAFVPVVRLTMHNWIVGLSYDMNVSKLKTASQVRGGFELTASFKSFLNTNSTTKNKVRCVGFR